MNVNHRGGADAVNGSVTELARMLVEQDFASYRGNQADEAREAAAREAETERAVAAMHDKADEMAKSAWTAGACTMAGGAASMGGAAIGDTKQNSGSDRLSHVLTAAGGAASGLANPASTLRGGRQAQDLDADVERAKGSAGAHETAAQAAHEREQRALRIADQEIETVQQILQARAATTTALLNRG
jgi:hypothetical protein